MRTTLDFIGRVAERSDADNTIQRNSSIGYRFEHAKRSQMLVLIDTSVWMGFFNSSSNSKDTDDPIDENLIVVKDVILTELVLFLRIKPNPACSISQQYCQPHLVD